MQKIVCFLIFIGFFASFSATNADIAPLKAPESSIDNLIALNSDIYSVSQETLYRTIKCESSFNPQAVGDHGTSFGIAQIHLVAHPDITKKQALDPSFSIDYLAKSIKNGKGRMWTCFKSIS